MLWPPPLAATLAMIGPPPLAARVEMLWPPPPAATVEMLGPTPPAATVEMLGPALEATVEMLWPPLCPPPPTRGLRTTWPRPPPTTLCNLGDPASVQTCGAQTLGGGAKRDTEVLRPPSLLPETLAPPQMPLSVPLKPQCAPHEGHGAATTVHTGDAVRSLETLRLPPPAPPIPGLRLPMLLKPLKGNRGVPRPPPLHCLLHACQPDSLVPPWHARHSRIVVPMCRHTVCRSLGADVTGTGAALEQLGGERIRR
mmetsp:Transcript_64967/g.209234  ORF Transcript_64967/g.209234 Transcript_64967/m.209234 type:complete len:254 (+) Transcript_64967:572-1333(+)